MLGKTLCLDLTLTILKTVPHNSRHGIGQKEQQGSCCTCVHSMKIVLLPDLSDELLWTAFFVGQVLPGIHIRLQNIHSNNHNTTDPNT